MKNKFFVLLMFSVMAFGCGNDKKSEKAAEGSFETLVAAVTQAPNVIDVKENMYITQLSDINLNYKSYLGKTVKVQGIFKDLHWDGKDYYFVYRRTPGCCGDDGEAGFELSWNQNYQGSHTGDDDNTYPAKDDWVEVQGVLKSYEISGFPFLYLALAELNVLETRGEEFVRR